MSNTPIKSFLDSFSKNNRRTEKSTPNCKPLKTPNNPKFHIPS